MNTLRLDEIAGLLDALARHPLVVLAIVATVAIAAITWVSLEAIKASRNRGSKK